MAHYAFLDENNVVTEVIVGVDENTIIDGLDPEIWYSQERGQRCKRTSYNTFAGKREDGGKPFRLNFASIGMTYDDKLDGFINTKLYESWILDESRGVWIPPIDWPTDGIYNWDEENKTWIKNEYMSKITEEMLANTQNI